MQIEKFKKLSQGEYLLTLDDNTTLTIHEDLILKYDLLLTKKVTQKLKEQLLEENKTYTVYNDALKYLNTKMRSIYEMKEHLKTKEYDDKLIDEVTNKLIKEKYLNDEVYATYFINDKINLTNDGPYKIIKELEKKRINQEYIDKHITKFTKELQEERIDKLINKQLKTNHNKSFNILKRKILDYLVNLGYEKSLVITRINSITDYDDSDIRQKEYDKLYKKLSKKYTGYELEQKLRQKMYEKGFYKE